MAVNLNQTLRWKAANADESAMLTDLQGSILKNHGREHTLNIFLRFNSAAGARQWIKTAVVPAIPNQLQQLKDAEHHKQDSAFSGPTFVELLLSRAGYDALNIPAPKRPTDARWAAGMQASLGPNGDPTVATWDAHLKAPHAMLLIGGVKRAEATAMRAHLKNAMGAAVTILGSETGKAIKNKQGHGLEHFGYVDGRSLPLMLTEDVENERDSEGGINLWDPAFTLQTALVRDPGGQGQNSHGSFFVFRKLEQNVKAFKAAEEQLALDLGLSGDDAERAGAMIVGRFEDGTPVVLHPDAQLNHPVWNNFNYDADPQGARCPFQGHIRKTNPRGGTGSSGPALLSERAHIMARRGITYGKRLASLKDQPETGVGLLFQAFMRDISNQFEFTQQSWANNDGFIQGGTGPDLVIGQPNNHNAPQQWPVAYGNPASKQPATVRRDLARFVTMKGGEYLFAPAISTLASL